ncbi:tRNA dimethylallyltransferase [subsurface metagenome]
MDEGKIPLLAILGPTASGKSGLAVTLAGKLIAEGITDGAEVICCDSRQLYKGATIGTATPRPEERAGIPHHLYNFLDPGKELSAGEYSRLAREKVTEVRGRGHLPILVGGSGFYFQALVDGLFEAPEVDQAVRERLVSYCKRRGVVRLWRILSRLDGESASRIKPRDRQRVIRAMEVRLQTGKPLSQLQKNIPPPPNYDLLALGIAPPREILYQLVEERVDKMIAAGLVEEVEGLLSQGVSKESPVFKAIGYGEIASHLEGETGLDEAVKQIKTHSRQYAKRQLTWFRRDKRIRWIEWGGKQAPQERAEQLVQGWLRGER